MPPKYNLMKQFMYALGGLALALFAAPSFAQVADTSALYRTLKANDSLLFERGFNHCDMQQFENLVADDLEFYHDKGGITRGKPAFIATIRNNICNQGHKPVRVLTPGSLEVFPLTNNGVLYGAIQTGLHSFRDSQGGQPEAATSEARFTHLWLLQQGHWKLARALSYDHIPGGTAAAR